MTVFVTCFILFKQLNKNKTTKHTYDSKLEVLIFLVSLY